MEKNKENTEDKSILRAKISQSESPEYDFSAIAVPTNNKQLKYSYRNEEYFYQVLRTGSENINIERLESGLPLFDNHPYDSAAINTLGISKSYEFAPEGLKVDILLGARADEALRSDIKKGIVKTVSIEGDVEEYVVERIAGEIPTYYAEKWTATSLSLAPIPNDIEAQIEIKRALKSQIEKSVEKKNESIFNSLKNKF